MKKIITVWLVLIIIVAAGYVVFSIYGRDQASADNNKNMANLTSTLETSFGNIIVEFYAGDAPKAVANFISLAQKGFYDGLSFHRVIPGFMIQGGDPYCGRSEGSSYKDSDENLVQICGTGGPGYAFEDELDPNTPSYRAGYGKGVLAMANSGPDTNGSQFFIMVSNVPLPHNYTIFGKVISGQEVADKISLVSRDAHDRPSTPAVINRVMIK